jgi:hypothetical protein
MNLVRVSGPYGGEQKCVSKRGRGKREEGRGKREEGCRF